MADLRPQYTEEAVGANHPTKADVINRAYNVEHVEDGTHKGDRIVKGWIQFDGTGVIAILDSFNVSSIFDDGVGEYRVYWDTDFANNDYAFSLTCNTYHIYCTTIATTVLYINVRNSVGNLVDTAAICAIAIGDQA